jgi:hypothetical protein
LRSCRGVSVATLNQWEEWTLRVPTQGLAHGSHVLTLEAWDLWDNKDTETITQLVDMNGPTLDHQHRRVIWNDAVRGTIGSRNTKVAPWPSPSLCAVSSPWRSRSRKAASASRTRGCPQLTTSSIVEQVWRDRASGSRWADAASPRSVRVT